MSKRTSEQLEAIAALQRHPGWQWLVAEVQDEIRGYLESLAATDPGDAGHIGRMQGAVMALRSILAKPERAQRKLQKGEREQ